MAAFYFVSVLKTAGIHQIFQSETLAEFIQSKQLISIFF
ncbi:hypothetical protein SASC598O11_011730 [Snodgrassella alvi SCGC AB-598-O11]|nr:hypothetical protein SASC598O11_011730 [Snodgrassella alvi SCGC AB-598-O11]